MKFYTKVKKAERKKRIKRAHRQSGSDTIITEDEDLGWAILLEGSWEWLFVGDEDPEFRAGDKVEVTIEKIE